MWLLMLERVYGAALLLSENAVVEIGLIAGSIDRSICIRGATFRYYWRAGGQDMKMKLVVQVVASVALLLTASACAAGTEASQQAAQNGELPRLLLGFWHGVIAPFTLIGEIINIFAPGSLPWSFSFYESRNTNVLYDIGFFIGILVGPYSVWTGVTRRRGHRNRSRI